MSTWNSDKSFQVMTQLGAAQGRFDRSAAQHSTHERKWGETGAESGPWFNLQVRSSSLFARLVKRRGNVMAPIGTVGNLQSGH